MTPTYYPQFPSWHFAYGETPSVCTSFQGWHLLTLGSQGGIKSTFHYRVWRWDWPDWVVTEVPLEERFIHAVLAVCGSMLFVFGLTEHGECFEQVPGFQPDESARVLGAEAEVILPVSPIPAPSLLYKDMLNRRWRRHRANLKRAGA